MKKFEAPQNLDYSNYDVKKTTLGESVVLPYLDTVSESLSLQAKDEVDYKSASYYSSLHWSISNYYTYNMKNLIRYIINTYLNDYFPEISIGTSNNMISNFDKLFDVNDFISFKDYGIERLSRANIFYRSTEAVSKIYNYLNNFAHYLATNYMIDKTGISEVIPIYYKLAPMVGLDPNVMMSKQDQYLTCIQIITEMFGIYYSFILESVYNILMVVSDMYNFPQEMRNKNNDEIIEVSNSIIDYVENSSRINTKEE